MSSAEFLFWQTTPEFLGAQREDFRTAQLRSTYINFAGRHLPDGESVDPLDLMPYYQKAKPIEGRWTRKKAAAQIGSIFSQFRQPGPPRKGS